MKPILVFALVFSTFLKPSSPPIHDGIKPIEIVEFQPVEKMEELPPAPPPMPVTPLKPKPVQVTGDKQTWLTASGIDPSDWAYVDYIIQKESGWNPTARNKSSGACGLPQALPCSKLGSNWDDPLVSLRWANNYANSRYGSWYQAYTFWINNHWW